MGTLEDSKDHLGEIPYLSEPLGEHEGLDGEVGVGIDEALLQYVTVKGTLLLYRSRERT